MDKIEAMYLNKLNKLKNEVFGAMLAAYRFDFEENNDKEGFEDYFNMIFNNINYTYTTQFIREFFNRNKSFYEENKETIDAMSKTWYSVDNLQINRACLDYYLNQYAWDNFKEITK